MCEGRFFDFIAFFKVFCKMPAVQQVSSLMGFMLMKTADCRNMIMNIMTGRRVGGMCQCRISVLEIFI